MRVLVTGAKKGGVRRTDETDDRALKRIRKPKGEHIVGYYTITLLLLTRER